MDNPRFSFLYNIFVANSFRLSRLIDLVLITISVTQTTSNGCTQDYAAHLTVKCFLEHAKLVPTSFHESHPWRPMQEMSIITLAHARRRDPRHTSAGPWH